MHRQHHDPHLGLSQVHSPGGLDAVHLGHRHVHEDHVGRELLGQLDGLEPVGRLADDVEALFGHRAAQALAQHAVIVSQKQPDRHGENLVPGWRYTAERRRPRRLARGVGCTPSKQRTRVPAPGSLSTWRVAPMLAARSRMPMMP